MTPIEMLKKSLWEIFSQGVLPKSKLHRQHLIKKKQREYPIPLFQVTINISNIPLIER
jgi:uncharacterized protein YqgQ